MGKNKTKEFFDELKMLDHAILDEEGSEMCNPVPANLEILRPQKTIEDRVNEAVARRIELVNQEKYVESVAEALDFEMMEEEDPIAALEVKMQDMSMELPTEVLEAELQKRGAAEFDEPKAHNNPGPDVRAADGTVAEPPSEGDEV